MQTSLLKVTIAHDYQCPWAWIALFQVGRLKSDFPNMQFNWVGYELLPEGVARPPERPAPSKRFLELVHSEGIPMHTSLPAIVSTHDAMRGAEYVKECAPSAFDAYNEAVYAAMWAEGKDIADRRILGDIARDAGVSHSDFSAALASKRYITSVKTIGPSSYNEGITHVPTFIFKGERCSEASYQCLSEMAERFSERYLSI